MTTLAVWRTKAIPDSISQRHMWSIWSCSVCWMCSCAFSISVAFAARSPIMLWIEFPFGDCGTVLQPQFLRHRRPYECKYGRVYLVYHSNWWPTAHTEKKMRQRNERNNLTTGWDMKYIRDHLISISLRHHTRTHSGLRHRHFRHKIKTKNQVQRNDDETQTIVHQQWGFVIFIASLLGYLGISICI